MSEATQKKNRTSKAALSRFLKDAPCEAKCLEDIFLLPKIKQAEVISIALRRACPNRNRKSGRSRYKNTWYPDFLNALQRMIRTHEKKKFLGQLQSGEISEKDVTFS